MWMLRDRQTYGWLLNRLSLFSRTSGRSWSIVSHSYQKKEAARRRRIWSLVGSLGVTSCTLFAVLLLIHGKHFDQKFRFDFWLTLICDEFLLCLLHIENQCEELLFLRELSALFHSIEIIALWFVISELFCVWLITWLWSVIVFKRIKLVSWKTCLAASLSNTSSNS